ncbi:MAG TPA: antibiotic biosynthesis monooxygenase [Armatimonadaceae bacterium]|nr:antibiotic biosynthesis monooxygenase [Armatimonadaceae bacterium]
MYVVCVTVKVTPGDGDRFLEAAVKNHRGSVKEPGCLRFDVLKAAAPSEPGEPEIFFLYEVYRTEEDFASHQQTAHYFEFRDAVAPIMAEPRKGVRFHSVVPDPWE